MTDYYEPRTLRAAIDRAMPLKRFFRGRLFSETQTVPTETVSIEFRKGTRKLAPFTTPQYGGVPASREGYEVRTFRTPYLLPVRQITNDTLAMKLLGESPYDSGMTPEDRAAKIAAEDLLELQNRIQRREEYMCAKCLEAGKIPVTGPGLNEEVDYGFTNIETTASGEKWVSNYDVIGKLTEKSQELRKNGVSPDMLVLGTEAANALLGNNKLQKLMDMRRIDMGEINPSELEDGVQYMGRLSVPGLYVDIYSYDEWYEDDMTNESAPMISPGTAMLLSSRVRNMMVYGAVTYIDVKTGEYVTEMREYVPYTNYSVNPPVKELYMASRPLPVPEDLESWSVMLEVV